MIRIILFVLLFLNAQIVIAQQSKDSLEVKANAQIYNEPDSAIAILNQLINKSESPSLKIKYYLLQSTAYIAKRDLDQSFKSMKKAQDLLKFIDDDKAKASVLVNVAIQYQQMELLSNSFENLESAEKLSLKLPDTMVAKYSMLGIIYAVRGTNYRTQSNPKLALEKFSTAITYFNKYKKTAFRNSNLSVIYYNIGYCYQELKDFEKARLSFLKSLELAKSNKATSLEAFALKGLGELYFYEQDYTKSLDYLNLSEAKANNIGDLILNKGIFLLKANNYLALKQTDLYRDYYKKYQAVDLQKQENEMTIISKSIDDNRVAHRLIIDEDNKASSILNISLVLVSLFALSMLVFFISKRIRINRLLAKEINEKFSQRKIS